MAKDRPQWLADLSRSFKRHRGGRAGWFVEVMRDQLRLVSAELPPRTDEPPDAATKRRAITLGIPPGPATAAAALAECCTVFDAVMAGTWRWPDPEAIPGGDDALRLAPPTLERLVVKLEKAVVGERVAPSTWQRMYEPFLRELILVAGQRHWPSDKELLETVLKSWQPNCRARQMAHDRIRRLWREAGWGWPEEVLGMRGNGKAAADPQGVRAFTDEELVELRHRIRRSRLSPAALVAWDSVVAFGLRPAELQGLEITVEGGVPLAHVTRLKKSSQGSRGARIVPAVPPAGWPTDCFDLRGRWQEHGIPAGLAAARSPGQALTQQLRRLRDQEPVSIGLDEELTAYSARHAFALRLAQQIGLHPREAAELMGHSPQVHLATYGRRLDSPKLVASVITRVKRAESPVKVEPA